MRLFWIFIGVVAAAVATAVILNAALVPRYYTQGGTYTPYGMMGFGWGYAGFWGFGAIMMIVPLILLIFFVFWIIEATRSNGRYYGATGQQDVSNKSALEIINERYASGSINSEEYAKMKEEITRK